MRRTISAAWRCGTSTGIRLSSPIAGSSSKAKPVIFCGDLNVAHTELDLANPKPNRGKKGFTDEERGGFQNFVDAGFIDTFRLFKQGNGHYSWWSQFFQRARTQRRMENRLLPGV